MMKQICIVGTGYVGLVSGVCFAHLGHKIICVDNNKERIDNLNRGVIPVYEQSLKEMVSAAVAAEKISFTTDLANGVENSEIIFICVGTHTDKECLGTDLSGVMGVSADIAKHMGGGYKVIVLKSTVLASTVQDVRDIISAAAPGADFSVVVNPEFLREGLAVQDFLMPERIVVGADDEKSLNLMREFYKPLTDKGFAFLSTTPVTANIIKYASNSFLAMKVMFINELSDLCESTGADITLVSKGLGLDSRIGSKFLTPGPGFGGSCLPKDAQAFAQMAGKYGVSLKLVETTAAQNTARKANMVRKINTAFGGEVSGKKLAILGITFKAGTDDMRASPAIDILSGLHNLGAEFIIYDPQGNKHGPAFFPYAQFAFSAREALQNADGAVILTEWPEFRNITASDYKSLLTTPVVVDLRNMYSLEDMQGITYHSIGRKAVK